MIVASACNAQDDPVDDRVGGPRWNQVLVQQADLAGLDAPPDETARRLVTRDEEVEVTRDCMEEQGYEVEDTLGGGISTSSGSLEEARRARLVCLSWYPHRSDLTGELEQEELRAHHEWMTAEVIPCIDDVGLPTDPVPSFEEFEAGHRADEPLWFPGDYDDAQLEQIESACALVPPLGG